MSKISCVEAASFEKFCAMKKNANFNRLLLKQNESKLENLCGSSMSEPSIPSGYKINSKPGDSIDDSFVDHLKYIGNGLKEWGKLIKDGGESAADGVKSAAKALWKSLKDLADDI